MRSIIDLQIEGFSEGGVRNNQLDNSVTSGIPGHAQFEHPGEYGQDSKFNPWYVWQPEQLSKYWEWFGDGNQS